MRKANQKRGHKSSICGGTIHLSRRSDTCYPNSVEACFVRTGHPRVILKCEWSWALQQERMKTRKKSRTLTPSYLNRVRIFVVNFEINFYSLEEPWNRLIFAAQRSFCQSWFLQEPLENSPGVSSKIASGIPYSKFSFLEYRRKYFEKFHSRELFLTYS